MAKTDLTRELKTYYTAKKMPELVRLPQLFYLSITGQGDPSGEPFRENIRALYGVAYTLKFRFKTLKKDFVVPRLEALWWFDEVKYSGYSIVETPIAIPRSEWEYRLLIQLPAFITENDLGEAVMAAYEKKAYPAIRKVQFFTMEEGLSVQMLHVGPFATEPQSLAWMHDFMKQQKLRRNGKHHEIYLSDFNKTPPEKLKTILREPVRLR